MNDDDEFRINLGTVFEYLVENNTNLEPISNLECELKFDSNLNSNQFKKLIAFFKDNKDYEFSNNISLDISIGNSYRITIPDENDNIMSFCRSFQLSKNDKYEVIQKQKLDDWNDMYFTKYWKLKIRKEVQKNIEQNMDVLNNEIKKNTSKFFRYKKRYSFISKNNFRIDMTVVKENKSIVELVKSKENFEMEIEYNPKNLDEKKEKENFQSNFIEIRNKIMKNMFGDYIIDENYSTKIIKNYKKLVSSDENNHEKFSFMKYNPGTMEVNDLINSEVNKTIFNEKYVVTKKLDGERHLLYIDPEGKGYLINSNLKVIECTNNFKNMKNTLIDGELMHGDNQKEFQTFDIYFDDEVDVRNLEFMDNENLKNKDVRFLKLKEKINNIKNYKNYKHDNIKISIKKFFPEIYPQKKSYIRKDHNLNLVNACLKYNNELVGGIHKLDGLIFQPIDLPVGIDYINYSDEMKNDSEKIKKDIQKRPYGGAWLSVLKWKPENHRTIDVMIDFEIKKNQSSHCRLYGFKNMKNNNIFDILFYRKQQPDNIDRNLPSEEIGAIELEVNDIKTKNIESKTIWECLVKYSDKNGYTYELNNIRDDKTGTLKNKERGSANAIKTIEQVKRSVRYPVDVGSDETDSNLFQKIKIKIKKEKTNYYSSFYEENKHLIIVNEDEYTSRKSNRKDLKSKPMNDNHRVIINYLISRFKNVTGIGRVFDMSCGKGADTMKLYDIIENSKDPIIVGIDNSKDSIISASDSAWRRHVDRIRKLVVKKGSVYYMKMDATQEWNEAYFKQLSININDIDKNELQSNYLSKLFWQGERINASQLDKKHHQPSLKNLNKKFSEYMKKNKFDLVNCQFAIHYFFKNESTLSNFLNNLESITREGSYFVGTCLDGDRIDEEFTRNNSDTIKPRSEEYKEVWQIKKGKDYDNNHDKTGKKISVFVDSIGKLQDEYLVKFEYLIEKMKTIGFEICDQSEMTVLGFKDTFSQSYGKFEDIYALDNELKFNQSYFTTLGDDSKKTLHNDLIKYSSLNNWFIFKKIKN